eukprot:833109-Pelagomonas_calceolata.AAC.2
MIVFGVICDMATLSCSAVPSLASYALGGNAIYSAASSSSSSRSGVQKQVGVADACGYADAATGAQPFQPYATAANMLCLAFVLQILDVD